MNNLPPKKYQFSLFNIPRYCWQVSHIPGLFMFMNPVFGGDLSLVLDILPWGEKRNLSVIHPRAHAQPALPCV